MGGGKGGGSSNAAAQTQATLAQQLFQESTPLRQLILGTPGMPGTPAGFGGFGREGEPFGATPAIPGTSATPGLLENLLRNPPNVPFERDVLESQFGRAREDILGGVPARGGQLNTALADLASQRALGVTGLAQAQEQQRIGNLFQTAGLATGQTQVALGGLGQAGSTLAAAGAARQQAQMQSLGLLGMGTGAAIGAGKAPGSVKAAAPVAAAACWIARTLYGRRSVEAALARTWIFEQWRGPLANVCRFLYCRYGRWLARRPSALWLLRPWFDMAVQKARG